MQFHNLKKNKNNKKARQVGRGGKRGKTSGRGTKGQNARAGRKKRPEMRDVIKRLPKLRGRGKNSLKSISQGPLVLNLGIISEAFNSGDTVSPKSLVEKGLITARNGRIPNIKILGGGGIKGKYTFENVKFSTKAKELVESAHGKVL
jgi:large subunit ribosomal protein L15